jgi:hypothetical protein
MLIGSFVGVNIQECISSDGSCNWTLSSGDWSSVSLAKGDFPPLQLSGRLFYLYIQVAWEILGILSILNLNLISLAGDMYTEFQKKVFYCGCLWHHLNFFVIIWITLLCTVPVNPTVFSVYYRFGHSNSCHFHGQ